MVVASLFIAAVIVIEGIPASWALAAHFREQPLSAAMVGATLGGMTLAVLLNVVAIRWVMRRGAQVLWEETGPTAG